MTTFSVPAADPLFDVGDEVLVDEGPRGPFLVKWIYVGLVPKVRDDLSIGSEPGYIYELKGLDGEHHQAVEYNLAPAGESRSGPVQPAPPPPGVPLDETATPIHYEGDTKSV